jgi:WD40 repeat protein
MKCGARLPFPATLPWYKMPPSAWKTRKVRFLGAAAAFFCLFVMFGTSGDGGIFIVDADGNDWQQIAGLNIHFQGWLDNENVLLETGSSLEIVNTLSGSRQQLADGPFGEVSLSPDKRHVGYIQCFEETPLKLQVLDLTTHEARLLVDSETLGGFEWSSDSAHIVYWVQSGQYFVSLRSGESRQYVSAAPGMPDIGDGCPRNATPSDARFSSCSPDNSELAVFRDNDGIRTLYVVNVATGEERALVAADWGNPRGCWRTIWSPDGQWLAFSAGSVTALQLGIRVSDVNGSSAYLVRTDGTEFRHFFSAFRLVYPCAWSPDGSRIAVCARQPPLIPEPDV